MAVPEPSSTLSFQMVNDLMSTVFNAEKRHLPTNCEETSTKHTRLCRRGRTKVYEFLALKIQTKVSEWRACGCSVRLI